MAYFILTQGHYEYCANTVVTTDIREVASEYSKLINEGAYGDTFDDPSIEIWANSKEFVNDFCENVSDEVEIISKMNDMLQEHKGGI